MVDLLLGLGSLVPIIAMAVWALHMASKDIKGR